MPKKLDEQLLSKIEEAYLSDQTQTYSSLSKRFSVGLSTLERIGRERDWARKRDQQQARAARKLIKQSAIVTQSPEASEEFAEFDQFGQQRILKIIRTSLIAFETAITENRENPRMLASLASGLAKLVEIHLKIQPLTVRDLVEILIRNQIGPDHFMNELRQQYAERNSLPNS